MNASMHEMLILAIDAALATLIWLVQLIIYPAFVEIRKDRFHEWHSGYMKAISIVVMPLMLAQAVLAGLQLATAFSWMNAAVVVCLLVAWLTTFSLSVPCHKTLQREGNEPENVRRLVSSNWLRTMAWSICLALHLLTICWL